MLQTFQKRSLNAPWEEDLSPFWRNRSPDPYKLDSVLMVFINFPWEKFEFHRHPEFCFCNKIYAIVDWLPLIFFFFSPKTLAACVSYIPSPPPSAWISLVWKKKLIVHCFPENRVLLKVISVLWRTLIRTASDSVPRCVRGCPRPPCMASLPAEAQKGQTWPGVNVGPPGQGVPSLGGSWDTTQIRRWL